MQFPQPLEASVDQVDIGLRCSNPGLGFLLEDVQHIHAAGPPDGVNGAKCVTGLVHNDFQHTRVTVAAQRLRARMPATLLGLKESLADRISHILMEGGKVPFGAANPKDRFDIGRDSHLPTMPKLA